MPKHDPYRAPRRFPVPFCEFLRIVIGGKYRRIRLKLYREFLRDQLVPADQIEQIIERNKTQGIPEHFYTHLRETYLQWTALRRTEKARKAAHKRWSQERRRKTNAGKLKILREALLDIDDNDKTAL